MGTGCSRVLHVCLTLIGTAFLVLLAGINLRRFVDMGNWLSLAVALHGGLAAFRLWHRRAARRDAPWYQKVIAWIDAVLPQGLEAGHTTWWAEALGLVGVGLALWGMVSLGAAFGVAPADRGLVTHGPYRFIRHPMYAGETLSLIPVVLLNPSLRNLALAAVLTVTVLLRIQWEEGILDGYTEYARRVRWRLLPGVW